MRIMIETKLNRFLYPGIKFILEENEGKLSESYKFLKNMGNIYSWILFGAIAGIYSFLVAVFLETVIAGKFFKLRKRNLLQYSFFANLISAGCGILFAIFGFNPFYDPTKWIIIAFVLTIVIECLLWILLLKGKVHNTWLQIMGFCIIGNVASYAFILITPFVVTFLSALIMSL